MEPQVRRRSRPLTTRRFAAAPVPLFFLRLTICVVLALGPLAAVPVRPAAAADVPPMPGAALADMPAPFGAPLPRAKGTPPPEGVDLICPLIAAEAARVGMPAEFFARLIWKESRFDIRAVSPKGAQGVAQFMPETARIRGLADPFDPAQAIAASADYLAELRARFGNLGLAAAAYNSGENRVERWMQVGGNLPYETVDYVQSITFRPVEWFREDGREVEPRPLEEGKSFEEACRALPVIATRALATAAAPWGVRVAGGITHNAALRAYRRAQRMYPTLLRGRAPIIVRVRRNAGAGRWLAMAGAESRAEARRLCGRLKAVGGNCVVRRN